MWGSIALAALDDDDDEANDKDEKKDDGGDGDGGVVLTASSSDIGSVQSRAKDGHDSNAPMDDGGGNAFGEYQHQRGIFHRYFLQMFCFFCADASI